MPERRPFPPSPRRRALARAAGLTPANPLLTAAAALGAAAATSAILARDAAHTLAAWLAAACDAPGTPLAAHAAAPSNATAGAAAPAALSPESLPHAVAALAPESLPHAVATIAAPLLALAAVAAITAHLAQTRGLWLPRRRIEGAPASPRRRGLVDLLAASVVGATAFAWLWLTAPRLAALVTAPPAQAALALAAFVATLAIAVIVLGTLDALLRHAALGDALAMTAEEKRQDDRLSAADPRWRARRMELARADARIDARADARTPRELIAAANLLVVGDDVAVAIAYDPMRRPTPTRVAAGRGATATQLLAHARRQALPIHRDAPLAAALAADAPTSRERPVPEEHWARLAEIIAAMRGR